MAERQLKKKKQGEKQSQTQMSYFQLQVKTLGDNERNSGYPDRGWPPQGAWHKAQCHTQLAQE